MATPALAADPPPAKLGVKRAEPQAKDCPDATALSARVNEITGWNAMATQSPTARLTIDVSITKDESGFAATLRASGSRTGTRHIADIGNDCSGLAEALAVTLAIILDDERSAPSDGVPPPSEQPPRPLPTPRTETPTRPKWRPYLTGVGTLGVLESPAFGVSGGVSLALSRMIFGAELAWLPARSFDTAPGSADVSLLFGSAYGCWQPVVLDPAYVGVCAHVSIGRLHGEATGYDENLERSRPWIAPGIGALGGGPITGPLEWFAQAKIFLPVHRERFVIDNLGALHETPPLGGSIALGLAFLIQ